jgi:hypothetical protein
MAASVTPENHWGPFAPGLSNAERLARLRALRALALTLLGSAGAALRAALAAAEGDIEALSAGLAAIDGLPALKRRHLLASYAALDREARNG